jgi:hypothetical protein
MRQTLRQPTAFHKSSSVAGFRHSFASRSGRKRRRIDLERIRLPPGEPPRITLRRRIVGSGGLIVAAVGHDFIARCEAFVADEGVGSSNRVAAVGRLAAAKGTPHAALDGALGGNSL